MFFGCRNNFIALLNLAFNRERRQILLSIRTDDYNLLVEERSEE